MQEGKAHEGDRSEEDIVSLVREKYGQTAQQSLSTSDEGIAKIAQAFGYSEQELLSVPAEANMGLSCGNPTAMASLREGEVVVDLGSGGGLDVFLAAQKVGPTGRAIGIDMTPEMVALAKRNAQQGPEGEPYTNVEFHLATIDTLPLPDGTADVIISNCVINLAPDKDGVFREMARVLKSGGRVAVSDIVLKQPLPKELKESAAALVGCIAGAVHIEEYTEKMRAAGFENVTAVDSGANLTAYALSNDDSCCCCAGPDEEPVSIKRSGTTPQKPSQSEMKDLFARYNINDYAASARVFATKP